MPGVKETRFLVLHELCEYKGRLNECNSNQKWNHNKCWFECKELDDRGSCEKVCMWNTRTCNCECNKACKIDEYLDTKSCFCKKHLIDKLVLACEVEILNRTETSLTDEKVTCGRKNCLIHVVSLKMI